MDGLSLEIQALRTFRVTRISSSSSSWLVVVGRLSRNVASAADTSLATSSGSTSVLQQHKEITCTDNVVPRLPDKSKMEDGGHIEFHQMLISPNWMNIFALTFIQIWYKNATWDRLLTTTARWLSVYNVVKTATTTKLG